MGYCTVNDVKGVLQFTETTWDFEIEAIIPTADAQVDAALAKELLTVPSPVPQLIKSASMYFAAWEYRRRRDPAGSEAFLAEATKFLETYVAGAPPADASNPGGFVVGDDS